MSVTARAVRLTAVLLIASACLVQPGVRRLWGPERYESVVFWGLPLAALLFAAILVPRLPSTPGRTPSREAVRTLAPWCAAGLVIEWSFLGIGHLFRWETFTFGDQALQGHPFATVVRDLPPCLLLGWLGWERALRGGILSGLAPRLGIMPAAIVAGLTGTVLAAPAILGGTPFLDVPFVAAAFAAAAARETACTAIVLSGGSLPLAGAYRGLLMFLEGRILNDVNGLFFPLANYTSSEPLFYLARGATALLSAAVVVAAAARRGEGR